MSIHKLLLTATFSFLLSFSLQAQKVKVDPTKKEFENKVAELNTQYKVDGFETYKAGTIRMEKNTEFPIFMELQEGRWYQFAVVGDPEATKIEMKLGLEGVGDFITDKFKTNVTNEYWTTFSFICPRSGRYLMTFYQKGHKRDMQGHVAVLQKQRQSEAGVYTFK